MKTKTLSLLALLTQISVAGAAVNPALEGLPNVGSRPAPAELTLSSYTRWAEPLLRGKDGQDYTSAFTPKIFAWFERNKNATLPGDVQKDKDKIFVNVAGPMAETIALEESGDIPLYTGAGAEVYAELQGTVDQALEAQLNVWGKPVGKTEGKTKPDAFPFSKRANYFAPNPLWGSGAFASFEIRRDGGIVKALTDRYLLLVRGDSQRGYDILMQFVRPEQDSKTTNVLAIAVIRPISPGKVAFKISSRYQGQTYLSSFLRSEIAFNPVKIHTIQKAYVTAVNELRTTGKITDKVNDL